MVLRSPRYPANVMPAVNSAIASMFSRISVRRCAGLLEGIHGLTDDGILQEGLDCVPVHDICGGTDHVGNIACEARIGEQAQRMRRIELDQDIRITLGARVSPCD